MESRKSIDLRGVLCPMNFVKTKAALSGLRTGDVLEVVLDEGEAIVNVPRSLKEEGHGVIEVEALGDAYRLLVRKGADS